MFQNISLRIVSLTFVSTFITTRRNIMSSIVPFPSDFPARILGFSCLESQTFVPEGSFWIPPPAVGVRWGRRLSRIHCKDTHLFRIIQEMKKPVVYSCSSLGFLTIQVLYFGIFFVPLFLKINNPKMRSSINSPLSTLNSPLGFAASLREELSARRRQETLRLRRTFNSQLSTLN